MNRITLFSVVIFLSLFAFQPRAGWAEGSFQNWALNGGEVEFGITSLVSAAEVDDPWVIEGGYNGAWWFNKDNTVGQTFTVSSDRLLQTVSARISAAGDAVGQFEIAIYEFDQALQIITNRLAFVTADAAAYRYNLSSVPTSIFDLSAFNITLTAGQTYMLTFRGVESSAGTFYVQAATDIYGGGSVYTGTYAASGPDLAGTWTVQRTGHKIRGRLQIQNVGTEAVIEDFIVSVYQSDDGATPGTLLHTRKISASAKHPYDRPKILKIQFPSYAASYVIAVIDSGEHIAEMNENNNVLVLHSPEEL